MLKKMLTYGEVTDKKRTVSCSFLTYSVQRNRTNTSAHTQFTDATERSTRAPASRIITINQQRRMRWRLLAVRRQLAPSHVSHLVAAAAAAAAPSAAAEAAAAAAADGLPVANDVMSLLSVRNARV